MQTGVVLIVVGAALLVVGSLVLRTRLPAPFVVLSIGAGAALTASGALLVQSEVTTADWIVALAVAVGGSLGHVRLLLGRFGPPAASASGTVGPANET